jgi:hypothetical protein
MFGSGVVIEEYAEYFWDILSCSPLKVSGPSGRRSANFQRTTWHYIPGSSTLHNHRHDNLKSYLKCIYLDLDMRKMESIFWRTRSST